MSGQGYKKVAENYYLYELNNGIRAVFTQTRKSHIVYCGFMVGVGSRDENEYTNGAAHFIEHGVFKGTEKRKSYQILNRIESVGGELNAFTTRERTVYYTTTLKPYFNRSIELLADIVFRPNFPQIEIEKEKSVIREEIEMYDDSPEESIFDEFNQFTFPGNSLGHNILGTQESVQKFTRKQIIDFWEQNYCTDNVVISIVGSLSPERVGKSLEKYLGDLPSSNRSRKPAQKIIYKPFVKKIDRDFQQVHCIIGNKAYSNNDQRKYSLFLINNILGGDWMSSRLNMSVREKHAYAYHVSSGFNSYRDTGTYSVQLGTDEKYLEKSIKLIQSEFNKIRNKKLNQVQLGRAKRQVISQVAMSNENHSSLMQIRGKNILDYGRIVPKVEVIEKINKINAEELMEVANEVLEKSAMSTLIYNSGKH
ncbi:M16 family metallopeptidase [Bacteroidota bacterium]